MTDQIEHVAVVGAGYRGGGIAQVFALAGMDVVIADADADAALTRRPLDRLYREAEDFEAQGLFDPGSAEKVRANLRAAGSVADHGPRLAKPGMLTELVESGRLGVKDGGGFVVPAGDPAPLVAYRNMAYARLGRLLRELGPAPHRDTRTGRDT